MFIFFAIWFATFFALQNVSKHIPKKRPETRFGKYSNRIVQVTGILCLAVLFLYPARPFVYLENGRWIVRSKAGVWEVTRDVATDSLRRNIVWDCAITLPLTVVLTFAAAMLVQATKAGQPK